MVSNDDVIRIEILSAAEDLGEPEVRCDVRDGFVTLSGPVSSEEHLRRLAGVAQRLRGVTALDNRLVAQEPEAAVSTDTDTQEVDLFPDFVDDIGTADPFEAVSEAKPYFPPTDPVVRPDDDTDRLEVVGGFGLDSDQPTRTTPTGDEELATAVEEALRLDAATAELRITVEVRDCVALLRGVVQSLEDIEMAESVAGSVPGIEEVREELSLEEL